MYSDAEETNTKGKFYFQSVGVAKMFALHVNIQSSLGVEQLMMTEFTFEALHTDVLGLNVALQGLSVGGSVVAVRTLPLSSVSNIYP